MGRESANRYPLQGLLLKQRWHLAVRQRELSAARAQQTEAQRALVALSGEQTAVLIALEGGQGRAIDPLQSQAALRFLSALRQRIAVQQDHVTQCEQRGQTLQQECLHLQARLDALESHRERSLARTALAMQQRALAQTDQDWQARSHASALQQTLLGETAQ